MRGGHLNPYGLTVLYYYEYLSTAIGKNAELKGLVLIFAEPVNHYPFSGFALIDREFTCPYA